MNNLPHFIWPSSFYILDSTKNTISDDILYPFAWDELMCRMVGDGHKPIVHFWKHPRAFVIGLRDRKLAYAEQAMAWLRQHDYAVGVRNSGGAAVPLDDGVVNISVIMPIMGQQLSFHPSFVMMVDLLQNSLTQWTRSVHQGEVAGSYCPGEYDLSITGRKFCGIAQRRQLKGCVVQAFVVVEGSGAKSGELARSFYNLAAAGDGKVEYPQVESATMASLAELLGGPTVTAEHFTEIVISYLLSLGGEVLPSSTLLLSPDKITETIASLRARYDK